MPIPLPFCICEKGFGISLCFVDFGAEVLYNFYNIGMARMGPHRGGIRQDSQTSKGG